MSNCGGWKITDRLARSQQEQSFLSLIQRIFLAKGLTGVASSPVNVIFSRILQPVLKKHQKNLPAFESYVQYIFLN